MVPICTSSFASNFSLNSAFWGYVWFSVWKVIIFLNSINQLIFVMVKCGFLFEVRTEFLNTGLKSIVFKGLMEFNFAWCHNQIRVLVTYFAGFLSYKLGMW
jgi:hypothetical protein